MILSGKPVAEKIYLSLQKDLKKTSRKYLAVILVGEDPASLSYVKIKEKIAERLGIGFRLYHLSGIASEKEVLELVADLNQNKFVSGIMVQLPLLQSFSEEKILKKIVQEKDIEGFFGKFSPPTAQAILEILKFYQIGLKNKKIVIVGYGQLVGKPLEKLLKKQGLKPIVCDSKTKDLKGKILTADILISAVGIPSLIKKNMVSEKAVVIDAGTAESKGKIAGDIAAEVYEKVFAYSPVPGGVGPVTVACLMRNFIEAAKK